MNFSSDPDFSILTVLPEAVDHARLIVGQFPDKILWCMKRGDHELRRGECAQFRDVRGIQIRAGIWDVVIGGLRTAEAVLAADQYGWQQRWN
jgi:hypothetical protein